jgi:hypothetical protein
MSIGEIIDGFKSSGNETLDEVSDWLPDIYDAIFMDEAATYDPNREAREADNARRRREWAERAWKENPRNWR